MNRLRELREDNDLSQSSICEYLNMSQPGYSKYELEDRDIPTEVLKRLAKFYNTSIDYLLYMTDERDAYPKSIMLDDILNHIDVNTRVHRTRNNGR